MKARSLQVFFLILLYIGPALSDFLIGNTKNTSNTKRFYSVISLLGPTKGSSSIIYINPKIWSTGPKRLADTTGPCLLAH